MSNKKGEIDDNIPIMVGIKHKGGNSSISVTIDKISNEKETNLFK